MGVPASYDISFDVKLNYVVVICNTIIYVLVMVPWDTSLSKKNKFLYHCTPHHALYPIHHIASSVIMPGSLPMASCHLGRCPKGLKTNGEGWHLPSHSHHRAGLGLRSNPQSPFKFKCSPNQI